MAPKKAAKSKKDKSLRGKRYQLSKKNSARMAANLKALREKSGFSTVDVGGMLGCTYSHVMFMESGRTTPSVEMLLRLRRAYKLKNLAPLLKGLR